MDLGLDAPMLCSDVAPADKDADAVADTAAVRTQMEMTLCSASATAAPDGALAPTPGEVQSGSQAAVVALA